MRVILHGSASFGLLGVAIGLLVCVMACRPADERPGLWLAGTPASAGVSDWSFSSEVDEIFIETRPWYGLPHSTTIWCVDLDGALYIGSYGEEKKTWEKAVRADPEARILVAGKLHEVVVTPVSDPDLSRTLSARYHEKYDMEAVFGEEVPAWWFYRVAASPDSVN
jgi:hypothetical protein